MEYSRYNGAGSDSRSSTDRSLNANVISSATPSSGNSNGGEQSGGQAPTPSPLGSILTAVKQEVPDSLVGAIDDETLRFLMSAAVTSSAVVYQQAANRIGGHLGGGGDSARAAAAGIMSGFQSSIGRRSSAGSYGTRAARSAVHVMQAETCVCEVCQVEFGRLEALFRHKLLHFNTGRVCYVCDLYIADGPEQLRLHVASQHRDIAGLHPKASDTAFVCPICVQRFSTSKALIKHQTQMHCVDLGRRLASGIGTSVGATVARSELSCAICALDFVCEGALIGHLNSPQHKEMKIKLQSIFICIDCRSIFSSRDSYAFHMMTRAQNETCDIIAAAQNAQNKLNNNNNNNNNNNGSSSSVVGDDVTTGNTTITSPPVLPANSMTRDADFPKSNGSYATGSASSAATPEKSTTTTTGSAEIPSPPWTTAVAGNRLAPPLLMPATTTSAAGSLQSQLRDDFLMERLIMRSSQGQGLNGSTSRIAASSSGGGGNLNSSLTTATNGFGLILEECSRRRNRQLETAVLLRILDETARMTDMKNCAAAAAAAVAMQHQFDDKSPADMLRASMTSSSKPEIAIDSHDLTEAAAKLDGGLSLFQPQFNVLLDSRPAKSARHCQDDRDQLHGSSTMDTQHEQYAAETDTDSSCFRPLGLNTMSSPLNLTVEQRSQQNTSGSPRASGKIHRRSAAQVDRHFADNPVHHRVIPPACESEDDVDSAHRAAETSSHEAGNNGEHQHSRSRFIAGSSMTSRPLISRKRRSSVNSDDAWNRVVGLQPLTAQRSCRSADFVSDSQGPKRWRIASLELQPSFTGITDNAITTWQRKQDADESVTSWNIMLGHRTQHSSVEPGVATSNNCIESGEDHHQLSTPHFRLGQYSSSSNDDKETAASDLSSGGCGEDGPMTSYGHVTSHRTEIPVSSSARSSWKAGYVGKRQFDRRSGGKMQRQHVIDSTENNMAEGMITDRKSASRSSVGQIGALQLGCRQVAYQSPHYHPHLQQQHQQQQQQKQQQQQPELKSSRSSSSAVNMCRHCDIVYADRMLYMLHMGLHNVNNPWQCNLCGTICSDRQQFALHVLHF